MLRSKALLSALTTALLAALLLVVAPSAAGAGVTFDNEIAVSITDGAATQTPGTTAVYTLVVSNAGPTAAQPIVSPTFSQGTVGNWTCAGLGCGAAAGTGAINDTASLSPGGSVTYTIPVIIPSSAIGILTAAITVDPTSATDDPANNTASDTDSLLPEADLSITKTDGLTTVKPGQQVVYTIVAQNAGPSDLSASVVDDVPAILEDVSWTCVGGGGETCPAASGTGDINEGGIVFSAGGSLTYTVTGTVSADADAGDSIVQTADLIASQPLDPDLGNNSATDTDAVADLVADLVAQKVAPATATVGGTIAFTIGARNDGPDDALEVVLTDLLPTGTTFVSLAQVTGPAATLVTPAVGAHGAIEASWPSLAAGASATFTLVVQLGGGIQVGDTVVNVASVDTTDDPELVQDAGEVAPAATIDPAGGNNSITTATLIVAQATTTTTTSTTLASTTTTARVGAGTLARTGGDSGGPTGTGMVVLGAGLVLVGAAELRRRRATM